MGRPTKYTQELADKICEQIATSPKSLRTIAHEFDIAVSSIMEWLKTYQEFSEQYAHARELQADYLAEEMLEIADDSSDDTKVFYKEGKRVEVENTEWVNRSKLRIETRKWIASKLKPKKYGDKIDIDHTTGGDKIFPIVNLSTSEQLSYQYGFSPKANDSVSTSD